MKPKKSLGQNFLTSGKAIFEIVKAGEIKNDDIILEIGPGKGALTEKLLESNAKKIVCIEKDRELIEILKEKFEKDIKNNKLEIIEGDVLNINPDLRSPSKGGAKILNNYKIIANIPYYITGAIIEKFLSTENKPDKMVLLVQKEVAERIVAKDKKETILSLAVKLYGEPKLIYKVSAGSFFPKPKVDSAVLEIKINKEKLDKNTETKYLKIIKSAFSHKRKMMLNNLKNGFVLNEDNIDKKPDWDNIFEKLNIDKKTRAEDLNKEIFIEIAESV